MPDVAEIANLKEVADKLPDDAWWRLKPGLIGLKRLMPNRAVRRSLAEGYGWPRHYNPVCSGCPHLENSRVTD